MQLLLWMSALFVVCASEGFELPGGLPDGSLITIYFFHKAPARGKSGDVQVNFYDLPLVNATLARAEREGGRVPNVAAYLSFSRNRNVKAAIKKNGHWHNKRTWRFDFDPADDGYWRIDLYKHNKRRVSVFFQGYYMGLNIFSLDSVKSLMVDSSDNTANKIEVRIKYPISNFPTIPYQTLGLIQNKLSNDKSKIGELSSFPVGSRIEMVALLRASGTATHKQPALLFKRTDGGYLLKIVQQWQFRAHELFMNNMADNKMINIIHQRKGSLLHLILERTRHDAVTLRLQYDSATCANVRCELTFKDNHVYMDGPITIESEGGASILHLDQIAAQKEKKPTTDQPQKDVREETTEPSNEE